MLRKIRIALALVFWLGITLLFLDFTGTVHSWLGWMAKIQFLPAVLSLNLIVIAALVLLTLLFGRVYCSVICPLGVMQDAVSWLSSRRKRMRYRFSYTKARTPLRLCVLILFIVAIVVGVGSFVALLAPYSSYGRIASNLLSPLWIWGNNLLAYFAERVDSYAFYSHDVWIRSLPTFIIAVVTSVVIFALAWAGGRTYCNTICPVGTLLGYLARFSWFKPVIDTDKCVNCGLCAKGCKSSCIDVDEHKIDYTRCVACMDCLDNCHSGAIGFRKVRHESKKKESRVADSGVDSGRRAFLSVAGMAVAAATVDAQMKKVDGGLAVILDKKMPERKTPIVPPGALSLNNFRSHCTGCQLCVSVCPSGVLRPSADIKSLMQPISSYENGYCLPECTKCSEVCPSGAIIPVAQPEKSSVKIGRAVWVKQNCLPYTDDIRCGNCARHCPSGAIQMVPKDSGNAESAWIPVVNDERCIGCGACENLCPARPFSAIYVEGIERHRII